MILLFTSLINRIRIVDNRNETNSPLANDSSHVIGTWNWDDNYVNMYIIIILTILLVFFSTARTLLFFKVSNVIQSLYCQLNSQLIMRNYCVNYQASDRWT